MEKQLEKFADKFETLGTHLKNAQQATVIRTNSSKRRRTPRNMLGAGASDPALENVQGTLALPQEASIKKGA